MLSLQLIPVKCITSQKNRTFNLLRNYNQFIIKEIQILDNSSKYLCLLILPSSNASINQAIISIPHNKEPLTRRHSKEALVVTV